MSNKNENENIENTDIPDQLTLLKEKADVMGITYHPNIGVDKLKAKIAEYITPAGDSNPDAGSDEEEGDPEEASYEEAGVADEIASIVDAEQTAIGASIAPLVRPTPAQQKMIRRKKATRLVRVRVTNMNPIKGNLHGEILSVGNSEFGFIKKFIPYNSEFGYHIPQILLSHLQQKKFMTHYDIKVGNKKVTKHKLIPEYAIEIMPPLTSKELQELKQRQAMARSGNS